MLCTKLCEPTDQRKKMLANVIFRSENFRRGGECFVTLMAPTANDLTTIGAAWLNEQESEVPSQLCSVHLTSKSMLYTLYLQALAIKGDRKYDLLRGEENTTSLI